MQTLTTWDGEDTPVCLITGSSHGLGLAVAETLARLGATVLISARDPSNAELAAAEVVSAGAIHALPVPLDVSDRESVDAAVATLRSSYGRLDILVNNAAAYVDWSETASLADLATSKGVMDTNLYGAWNVIQACLPLLRSSEHPRIVNITSGAGSHGDARFGRTARPWGSGHLRCEQGRAQRPHRDPRGRIRGDTDHHQCG